jgi:tRNA A-37 threonylcarbamoyl transferase component Bud32
MTAVECGFNRSIQHLLSKLHIEEDVDYETTTENLLHRRTKGIDVYLAAITLIHPGVAYCSIASIGDAG